MSYRDAAASLRAYRDRIAGELEGVRRAAGKVQPLERELAETERLLQKMVGKRELPLLDRVQVAAPCKASWDEMVGDDRVRFCGQCEKNVYNLSAMPRDEAEVLLRDREGPMCVRLCRRADGTVLSTDCPVGVKRRRRRRTLAAVVFGSGVLAAAGTGVTTATATMGEMPLPRPPASTPGVLNVTATVAEPVRDDVEMGDVVDPAAPSPPWAEPAAPGDHIVMGTFGVTGGTVAGPVPPTRPPRPR